MRVGDEVGAPFQADSPGDAAQVNQAEPGRAGELQDAERALGCGRVRAGLERQDLHRDGAAVAGSLGETAKLSAHHFGTADLLVQRGLADDQVNVRLMLDQDGAAAEP